MQASIRLTMTAGRLRSRFVLAIRSERGMALPTALFAIVASLGLAGAAVMSSVDVQQSSHRDSGSKSAIAAADAGANVAMMQINRDRAELSTASCLGGATPTNGWCPPVTGEVGGATYSYRMSQASTPCGEFDLCVAVTGTAGEVSRRVLITFNRGPGSTGGGGSKEEEEKEEKEGGSGSGGGVEGLIGKEGITLSGSVDIRVGIGTDGNIVKSGASGSVCPGDIRHGIGKKSDVKPCSGYEETEGNVDLPPVTDFMPSDIASHNSNGRITKCTNGLPTECEKDGYNGKWTSTSPLNPSTRSISLSGNETLSLGGGDYWLCQLSLSGTSELIMAAGAHVRLFFDTPEHCGTSNPISLSGTARIVASGYQPTKGQFDMPGFFVLGSPTIPTTISLSGNVKNVANELVVYAPNSTVNMSGNATYKGVIVGKQVNMSGSVVLEHDPGFELPPSLNPWFEEEEEAGGGGDEGGEAGVPPVFTPQFYVECSGAATTPDANC
jgi:hypothetical protein